MRKYEPRAGESIRTTALKMVELAVGLNESVTTEFNGMVLTAEPTSTARDIEQFYLDEMARQQAEYEASPECKAEREKARVERERHAQELASALADAPAMTFRDESYWRSVVAANASDDYGAATLRYAEKWARLMEAHMAQGAALAECAERTSHLADDEGISGNMHYMARAILYRAWVHGEELKKCPT